MAKYIFTASNGQLLVKLKNISSEFADDESLSYNRPSVQLFGKKINLFDFGEFQKDFKISDIETIDSVVPTDITNAFDLLLALFPASTGSITSFSNGQTAHSSPSTGSPIRIAGRVKTTNDTTLTSGDASDVVTTTDSAVVVKPYAVPELDFQFACTVPVANTADLVLKTASSAGLRNYITGFQIINASATVATEIVIKDGASVIWRGYVGIGTVLNSAVGVTLQTPLRGSAATALNFACITTGSSVYVNFQGYVAP